MKLLGIARVSTEEQAGDNGAGLNRQHDAIQRVAEANDAKLIGIVNIVDVSGSDVGTSKEWLTQVLPIIMDPDVHLAIDALDRLIRASTFAAFGVLAACQSTHTRIYTPAGTHDLARPDGVLVSGLLALIGGKEKAEIVRRSQAGKEAKRQRGQWVQSVDFLPRGIAYDRKTQTWSYTPAAEGVREMFRLAAEGATQAEISRRTGVPSQTIRALLQNPIYDGRLVFTSRSSGRIANSKHQKKIARPAEHVIDVRVYSETDQLVPHELWLSAQARLRAAGQAHRRTREATAPSSWASAFLYSWHEPDADGTAARRHIVYGCSTGADPGKVPRYMCRCKHGNASSELRRCGLVGFRCDVVNPCLDRYLTDLTHSDWLVAAAFEAVKQAKAPDTAALGERTARALAALDRREKRLLDLYEHDGIDLHEHTARREVIKTERAVLRQALANAIAVPVVPSEIAIRAQAQAWRWNAELPPEQKRKWLAKYVQAICIANHAIVQASFRVYGDDGSVVTCTADRPAGWHELLGHAPTGIKCTAAAQGAVPTSVAADSLGISGDMLRWYVAHGVVTFNGAMSGNKRLWTQQNIDVARQELKSHRPAPVRALGVAAVSERLGQMYERLWEPENAGSCQLRGGHGTDTSTGSRAICKNRVGP